MSPLIPLWIAYASVPYYRSLSNNMARTFWLSVAYPLNEKNCLLPVAVEFDESRRFVRSLIHFEDGLTRREPEQRFPQPYAFGFTNSIFSVREAHESAEAAFPKVFVFRCFAPNVLTVPSSSNDLALAYAVDVFVTNSTVNTVASWVPTVNGPFWFQEKRFFGDAGGRPFTYSASSWLSLNDARRTEAFRKKEGPPPIQIKAGVVALLIAIFFMPLFLFTLLRRRLTSKDNTRKVP